MSLLFNKTLLILFLLITVKGVSQSFISKSFDSIFNSDLSNIQKFQYVDSISNLENLPSEKLSLLYHEYSKYLFKNSDSDKHIFYIKKAIEIREHNKKNDLKSLKKSLFNLGSYYKNSGLYFKSIKVFNQLLDLPGEDRIRYRGYTSLIYLCEKIGDFEKSINYFKKVEKYYFRNNMFVQLSGLYSRVSRVYVSMDAKKYNKLIIDYLTKVDSLSKYQKLTKKSEAIINSRLGIVYRSVNDNEKALFHYRKSLELNKDLNDSLAISKLYNNIGHLYLKDSLTDDAKKSLDLSLMFLNNDKSLLSTINSNYGEYFKQLNAFEIAKKYYQSSIDLLVYGKDKKYYENPSLKNIEILSFKLKLLNRILDKGNYWYQRYHFNQKKEFLQKALSDYKLADKILDIIRFDSSENISKLFWREKETNLYIKAIEVSHLLNDQQSAYVFMEKNKALLLLENLNDFKAKSISNLPIDLIERDFKYKQKIIKIEESTIENKANILFDTKTKYEKFKDSLSIQYPYYSKLRKALPILNFDAHKSKFIDKDNATIQFIISKNKAYGFMISNNTSNLYEISGVQYLEKEIIEFTKMLQYPFYTQEDIDDYVKTSNSIFNKLIPVSIYKKIKDKKLSISSDGILHNIPFEALITDAFNENSYLIKNNDISYVYSFSHLLLNNKRKRNPKNTFLGFAPNKFSDESLATLPNSIEEVKNINSIFKDKIFINGQASKYNFISNLDDYKLIHLATHSGQNNFEKPWLAFNDSKVNLNEIYATQNQADLVVLSACKTSNGKLFSGEGVMSLARGFFISGTKSVISSLWNINDKTTQIIMSSFYKNLKAGKSKSKALQDSKLAYLQSNDGSMSSPYYWSSFILIGDSQIVYFNDSSNFKLFLAMLLVVLILVFVFKKVIKR